MAMVFLSVGCVSIIGKDLCSLEIKSGMQIFLQPNIKIDWFNKKDFLIKK
jgi:hypothetical protein